MSNNDTKQDISSKAQPGSQESGIGGETKTAGGDSQVDVKNVLNTNETGKPPENTNVTPDNSQASEPREGNASDISAKELLNTHGSGEPDADNVNVSGKVAGYDDSTDKSSDDRNPKEGNASDISAKEGLNTHGSGEPDADNVGVEADSQAGK